MAMMEKCLRHYQILLSKLKLDFWNSLVLRLFWSHSYSFCISNPDETTMVQADPQTLLANLLNYPYY